VKPEAAFTFGIAALATLLGGVASPRAPGAGPRDLLAAAGGLSPAQIGQVERGQVVVRTLAPTARHEVAVAGAVRLAASKDAYLDFAEDMARQARGAGVLQGGTFGTVPAVEDLASLRLDETEFAALRRCARGDCSSKLAALAPEAFRTFDWSAPAAQANAEALVRTGLAARVRDYSARGEAGLMVFDRTRFPTSLATEVRGLASAMSPALTATPELATYLANYPHDPLAGGRSILRWSRTTFGLKPVLAAHHLVVYRPPSRPGLGVTASTQFYASRYFDASLELTVAADAGGDGTADSYVLYVGRWRVDSLRGVTGGMSRGSVEREVRSAATRLLSELRAQVDRARAGRVSPEERTP
jgi:hypothetical protein